MIALFLSLIGALFAAAVTIYVLATRRIAKAIGQDPEEAAIEEQTKADALALVNAGEQTKAEVLHADRNGLLARLRDRVRGK